MHRVTHALCAEHRRLAKVLAALDGQAVDLLELRPVDFDLTRRIVVYCDEYASALHHPLEELMVSRLVMRSPAAVAAAQPMLEQHSQLNDSTDELLRLTELLLTDAPIERTTLADKLRRFARHHAEHRDYEEREVFPLAERMLTQGDWAFLARFRQLEKRFDQSRPSHHGHKVLQELLAETA
jgi:hemerythrin-like domain-containing protein